MSTSVELIDNSAVVLSIAQQKMVKALEECGLVAEGYAKMACPVDTGALRNSISHAVVKESDEICCYIGTNMHYAPYIEYGTGIYASGGRQTPWSYQDSSGQWHTTYGNKPQPFLRPAVSDHTRTYKQIVEESLRG